MFQLTPSLKLACHHLRHVNIGYIFRIIQVLTDDGGNYEHIEAAKNDCEEEVDENNNVERSPQLWSYKEVYQKDYLHHCKKDNKTKGQHRKDDRNHTANKYIDVRELIYQILF